MVLHSVDGSCTSGNTSALVVEMVIYTVFCTIESGLKKQPASAWYYVANALIRIETSILRVFCIVVRGPKPDRSPGVWYCEVGTAIPPVSLVWHFAPSAGVQKEAPVPRCLILHGKDDQYLRSAAGRRELPDFGSQNSSIPSSASLPWKTKAPYLRQLLLPTVPYHNYCSLWIRPT